MAGKQCHCGDTGLHARAVEQAVFQSLLNAMNDPENERRWFRHADLLEGKFTTEHGAHYSTFTTPQPRTP